MSTDHLPNPTAALSEAFSSAAPSVAASAAPADVPDNPLFDLIPAMDPPADVAAIAPAPLATIEPHYVHLRLHSELSLIQGIVRIDEAVESEVNGEKKTTHQCPPVVKARRCGMPAVALTDLNNLFGAVRFYKAATAAGIQPIIGADCSITHRANRDQPFRVLLLVASAKGYLNLCQLISRGYLENQFRGQPELERSWLTGAATEGLIALSGAADGDVGQALAMGDVDAALNYAQAWKTDFPECYYLELQRAGRATDEDAVEGALHIAGALDLPAVVTHPILFMEQADFLAHEAKVCIARGYTLSDTHRPRDYTDEQYFKTQSEMVALFADVPEALANSAEIARRCSFDFVLGVPQLPVFPTPPGQTAGEYLSELSLAGLARRLALLYPDAQIRETERPRYVERLAFEVATIIKMGFPGYFLIVQDFISWAKNNGVPVGPGRGSGAGSLVAYSLGITDIDPLKYELLFERFLNPDRVSMPDFDIDFCPEGRDRVIDYVKDKYGHANVSQISTFGTMAAKAVLRDVGRVMEWGYNRTDELAKLIPFMPGKNVTLAMAREMEPKLRERELAEEETRELLALAEQLEGMTRNVGMHAGGVLIAPGKLTDFTPLYCAEGSTSVVSQYDKDDVEAVGLVKFDFLGLTTLTIIAETVRHVHAMKLNEGDELLDIDLIALDDLPTYRVFQQGSTTAIFQFESKGMRDLLKKAKPDRLEDLIALNALYRPGPMDLIPEFIERKHGRVLWEYLDARIAPILDPTYGIMIYQEQVMQTAQVVGGYSLGGADLLRRAMGKKKPEEMAEQRIIFNTGAEKGGLAEKSANELFDLMEKFAGYGFNKSHAAAYAWVAYQTAFLKAHYPAAFMAANCCAVLNDTDKVKMIADDAREIGLEVLKPDVNKGTHRFMPIGRHTIRYGLGALKGTGEQAINNIEQVRTKGGLFKDLADFCRRVDRRLVNKRTVEALIRGGAFDLLNPHRASLLASLGPAIALAEKAEAEAAQVNLFGDAESVADEALRLIEVPEWSNRERLANERQALGYYLSGHPFSAYAGELRRVARTPLSDIVPNQNRESSTVAGIIDSVAIKNSKRGRMAIVNLDDGTAKLEVMVMGELFNDRRALLVADQPVVLEGKISFDDFSGGLRMNVDKVMGIDDIRAARALGLRISMNGQADAKRLATLLRPHCQPEGRNVQVRYSNGVGAADYWLGSTWKVRINEVLVRALTDWLDEDHVEVVYE